MMEDTHIVFFLGGGAGGLYEVVCQHPATDKVSTSGLEIGGPTKKKERGVCVWAIE